ncbi:MAG: Lrp/AsnC family transcriptional regulator [Gammaproteobacteria bacterium]|nr:Lrp/AsnC family transcriptional regulator [Gammaproteobacteria bacterium]
MRKFDRFDHLILQSIQVDDSIPVAELAEKIGLSTNACWRRIKRLEETGVIRSRVALLDEQALDLNVTVFVSIKTSEHTDSWLTKFANGVKGIPEVIEFYRMSGDTDYLLKIVVRDIADYDRVYKKLIQVAPMSDVSSSFSMERIKSATTLPLDHLGNQ